MFTALLRLPIVSPAVLVPVDVVAGLLVLWVLVGRRRGVLARATGLLAGAALGLVVIWWLGDVRDEFGVDFTPVTRMWLTFASAALGLCAVVAVQTLRSARSARSAQSARSARTVRGRGFLSDAPEPRRAVRRRLSTAIGATAVVALAAGLGVNVDFGAYRTIGQVVTTNPYPAGTLGHEDAVSATPQTVDTAAWRAPAGMPRHGRTLSVRIPGTVSHFRARKAVVWLPPAALTPDPPTLPVLIALSGQPGQPADMFQSGDLGRTLGAYASAHRGLAPIVVAPDQLGAPGRNPMCVDSRGLGRSATYVMTDTVHWIRTHLDVASTPAGWGIAGFSEGATCAMQFSTGHPEVFGTALAISSELAPRNGSEQHTVQVGFNGSEDAYRAAAPIATMHRHGPYRDHLTVFGFGQDDAPYRASTTALRAAAVRAGMQTALVVSPGSAHDWNTVRYVLAHGLPPVLTHLGLPATAGPR
ncbi:esterase family protein [Curtobacterium sp. ZW137]|uniref:alpha/beta hydrolase n=1 Tax=Curtobacterium sp. ZW137 TaxID=2485104 RepID=UPI000FC2E54F|nr:alpha/beta hydrolase-fold protein [Curtobacterium sp. ZW137]ROP60795.1 enterochelin esterase-like enzyme [Curtobacterium sp. ZW137]